MTADNVAQLLVWTLVKEGVLQGEAASHLAIAGPRGEGLVTSGLIPEAIRLRTIARLLHLDFVEPDEDFVPEPKLIRLLSPERLRAWQVLPLSETERELRVASAYPYDPALEDRLYAITGKNVRLALCDAEALSRALARAQLDRHILEQNSAALRSGAENRDEAEQGLVHDLEEPVQDPVVALVNQLCRDAVRRAASDVHLECRAGGLAVRYRVDGVLTQTGVKVGISHAAQMVARLKVMAGLDIAEHQLPQDGRFRLTEGGFGTDVRVSVMPTVYGEDVVLRFLDRNIIAKGGTVDGLEALGFEPRLLGSLRATLREPAGMILVAGPTGSGKTTTLYAALTEVHSGHEKIVTIEDPVEYQLPGVVQVPVNEARGLTFAKGLRAVLRHDPDCLLVGEIRDPETAGIAVQAAMTGHLVFSTVHANEPLDVIARMNHMGIDRYNFLSSLRGVISQRLLRCLCMHCRRERALTTEERDVFLADGIDPPTSIKESVGCTRCDESGYRGRTVAAELLLMTPMLREHLLDRVSPQALRAELDRQGNMSIRRAALQKVVAGITSLSEVDRVIGRGTV